MLSWSRIQNLTILLCLSVFSTQGFTALPQRTSFITSSLTPKSAIYNTDLHARKKVGGEPVGGLTNERKKQLGVQGDEDEYDLDVALEANTDPLITKIIAGAAILSILSLLVVGVVIPSLSDYGEGVCIPIQNGGRC